MISSMFAYWKIANFVVYVIGIGIALGAIFSSNQKLVRITKYIMILSIVMCIWHRIGPKILTADTQNSTVQVKIEDQVQDPTLLIYNGKCFIPFIGKKAISVKYDEQVFWITDRDVYEKYKNKIGTYVDATLKTTVYVDGSIHREILDLKDITDQEDLITIEVNGQYFQIGKDYYVDIYKFLLVNNLTTSNRAWCLEPSLWGKMTSHSPDGLHQEGDFRAGQYPNPCF